MIAQASFVLLARGRLEQRPVQCRGGIGDLRKEGLRIADIGCEAIVEQIDGASPPGEFLGTGVEGGLGRRVGGIGAFIIRPVLAAANGETPVADTDLILKV